MFRFLHVLLHKARPADEEKYAYKSKWEPLNVRPSSIAEYAVTQARKHSIAASSIRKMNSTPSLAEST